MRCDLLPLYDDLSLVQLISIHCTLLLYRVLVSNNDTSCYVQFFATSTSSTDNWYIYFIDIKTCPIGFENYNGSCECNEQLKAAMPSLTCDIETQSITFVGNGWIGLSYKQNILYAKWCQVYCFKTPTTMHPTA